MARHDLGHCCIAELCRAPAKLWCLSLWLGSPGFHLLWLSAWIAHASRPSALDIDIDKAAQPHVMCAESCILPCYPVLSV